MAFNSLKRASALLVAGLLASAGCSSSDGKSGVTYGTLAGTVTSSGSAVSGVTVTTTPAVGSGTATDSSGKYSLVVPVGSYTVSFNGDNLEPFTSTSAAVTGGNTTTVDAAMTATTLKVAVTLPDALKNGGPAGFNTTVSGITASATVAGTAVTPDSVEWSITDYWSTTTPPTAATPSPATGTTTSFAIPTFEEVRVGANAWMSARYGTTGTANDFEYIQAPERDQLLSFGVEQVRAMSYKVVAKVTAGGRTATGSAVVAPVTISSGGNTLPLGMMVVGNGPSTASSFAWTLTYISNSASPGTAFGAPPAGVTLAGADTKNPYFVPTVVGVYQLTNGSDAPLSFRVSTYHGAGTSDADQGADGVACNSCHSGQHAMTEFFAEWNASAHGNFYWTDPTQTPMGLFQSGVTGVQGTHYSESCISCHVVGYSKVPTAVNAGFDDVAKDAGWTFPTTYDAAAWATVTAVPGLKHRAGIQCENCHGPLEPTEHSAVAALSYNYGLVPPIPNLSAGVCMTCHDALTHHDRGSLWSASGHANTELALEEGTVDGNPTSYTASSNSVGGAAHCGRCHSGEGFLTYVAQQQGEACANLASSDPNWTVNRAGYIRNVAADGTCSNIASAADATTSNTFLATKGMTKASAHSQTCATCHDPHKTELRVAGDSQVVAGLFNVQNAGAGALCIVCHNSRSAAIKQGNYSITSWSRLGPHTACQGDMFAGRNAFFIDNLTSAATAGSGSAPTDLPDVSVHKFMGDTCVDCHVKWVPSDLQAQYNPANTNHTFRSSTAVCAECHSADMGDRIQESITEKMANLQAALGNALSTKMMAAGFATAAGSRYDPANTSTKLTDPATLTILPAEIQSITAVGTTNAVIVRPSASATWQAFQVTLASINNPNTTTAMFSLSAGGTAQLQTVAKAYFNLLYVVNDGAKGVHNPRFAAAVLDNAAAAVNAVTIP